MNWCKNASRRSPAGSRQLISTAQWGPSAAMLSTPSAPTDNSTVPARTTDRRSGRIAHVCVALLLTAGPVCSQEQQLTFDGNNKRDPIFINNGAKIAYAYDERDDFVRSMTIDMSELEADPKPLFGEDRSHQTELACSSDNRYIAFVQCTGNLSAKLVIRDLQDNKESAVVHNGRGGYRTPFFTPDGTRVVYAFAESGPQQLWSVDLQCNNKKQLQQQIA